MYAVIKTGGKQYKVKKGDSVIIEKLTGEEGEKVAFEEVLFVGGTSLKIGAPVVEGAKVEGEIARQSRAKKVIIYKKKRRKGYEVRKGHRQYQTTVKITAIHA